LADDRAREELVAELAKLKAKVGHGGASQMAAELILREVMVRSRVVAPKPHFRPGMNVASSGGADRQGEEDRPPAPLRPKSRAA
jgi:hypothetical protein